MYIEVGGQRVRSETKLKDVIKFITNNNYFSYAAKITELKVNHSATPSSTLSQSWSRIRSWPNNPWMPSVGSSWN